ncbi:MAG TPA: hypothetical protein VFX19_06790 [Dehalococcoidia bacterium]|nr:hypothetical protein [Dehalococcoidia bacterium]
MKKLVLGVIVGLLALSVVAYAFAAGDGGGSKDAAPADPTSTAIAKTPAATSTPVATTTTVPSQAAPTAPVEPTKSPDSPVSATAAPPGYVQPAPTTAPAPSLPPDLRAEPAPIDGLDISVAESFPPQYFLHVHAGLPSGCAKQYTHSVERSGNVITVTVLNSVPKDAICTAIYGMYDLNIGLGSDFVPGQTYTVNVNDKSISLTAQ